MGLCLLLGSTALGSLALAEPEQCAFLGEGRYRCTGDQRGGIVVGRNSGIAWDAATVTVEGLTAKSTAEYREPFVWESDTGSGELRFHLELSDIDQIVGTAQPGVVFTSKPFWLKAPRALFGKFSGSTEHETGRSAVIVEGIAWGGVNGSPVGDGQNGRGGSPGGDATVVGLGWHRTATPHASAQSVRRRPRRSS